MVTVLDLLIRPGKDNKFPVEVFERGNSQSLASSTFEYDLSFMKTLACYELIIRHSRQRKTPLQPINQQQIFGLPGCLRGLWWDVLERFLPHLTRRQVFGE